MVSGVLPVRRRGAADGGGALRGLLSVVVIMHISLSLYIYIYIYIYIYN